MDPIDPTEGAHDAEPGAGADEQTDETVSFDSFGFDPRILEAISALGFEQPTPIQCVAMPSLLSGRDVVGGARTGSGKTAAFGLPLLQKTLEPGRTTRALVLAPTRELCVQITQALQTYAAGLRTSIISIYGGVPYPPQLRALRAGPTVVVGTPGRIIDHLDQGRLDLSKLEMVVLDEADEMLRMGFIDDVEKILSATPEDKQVALFSATMPPQIRRIAQKHLRDPIEAEVDGGGIKVDHISQWWIKVPQRHKLDALIRVLTGRCKGTTLVFARTRRACAEVADELAKRGLAIDALHGDLNQAARERVLSRLRTGRLQVVIATDVAARGIDVDHIEHVINFDLPNEAEIYVHRIGRTGRAGRAGEAISFVTPPERRRVRFIRRDLGAEIHEAFIPTDADIAAMQRWAMANALHEVYKAGDLDNAKQWLTELTESSGVPVEDIAAAAVQLLALRGGNGFTGSPSEEPPPYVAPPRPAGPRDDGDHVDVFVMIGRQAGVRPGDLVGALTHGAGLNGSDIGRITLLDRKSFIGMPRPVAERLLNEYREIEVRGNMVSISAARAQEHEERGPTRGQRPAYNDRRGGHGGADHGGRRPFRPPGRGGHR